MGIIRQLLGGGARQLSGAVSEIADGFRPNATQQMQLGHDAYIAALEQHATEFKHSRPGWFDAAMNGLNRLPRPMLALGTIGLFIFAMVDPEGFAPRMEGLALVPDPLWWLLGAIVSFYFGARELHYSRRRRKRRAAASQAAPAPKAPDELGAVDVSENAALSAWQAERGG